MPPLITTGLAPGQIQLYDNYIPSLAAGSYDVKVAPTVTGIDASNWFVDIHQRLEVRQPQFTVDPVHVGERFPPDRSNGLYAADLPFVVLNDRALPWEREITGDRTVPWMALLTLQTDEIVLDPVTNRQFRSIAVAEFLAADPAGKIQKPDIKPEWVPDDVLHATMQSIVIPAKVFSAVVPRLDELASLTHVRATDTGDQAESDAIEDGWYGIVISNRFPDSRVAADLSGSLNFACLVSPEGFTSILPGNGAPSMEFVQLCVLANWSFVSNPAASESFSDLMESLVTKEAGNPGNLLLRIPAAGAPSPALTRLQDGYAPFSYHTPVGEDTFAWYRGPLTPVMPQPLPRRQNGTHYLSSSEVTIYQQNQGVFDLSYAAAFQIGRAVGLADRAFSIGMLNSRREVATNVRTIQERIETGRYNDLPVKALLEHGLERKNLTRQFNAGATERLRQTFLALNERTATKEGAPLRRGRNEAALSNPHLRLQKLFAREDVQQLIAEQVEGMNTVTDFLAALALLQNVPFNQLIPYQRMLPPESIRFFYVDQDWIESLVDGALSIGVDSSRAVQITGVMREPIRRVVRRKVGLYRAKRRKLPHLRVDTTGSEAFPARSGILIRSALVAGWPGLVVRADDGSTEILRMERLSDDVLIILFNGIPQTVRFSEPWHGLRFGVRGMETSENKVQLRSAVGAPLNRLFPENGPFRDYYRTQSGVGQRVIDVQRLLPALASAAGFTMSPAGFATEMFQAPQRLSFV
ncbi:MAG TPA: hypothetical protein VGJ82_14520 [Thermoanaerobaculia bacterium]